MKLIESVAARTKQASLITANLASEVKHRALGAIAASLLRHEKEIVRANCEDLARAADNDLSEALQKRLRFDGDKLRAAVGGIESLIDLGDPVGQTLRATELDEGLELYQVSCPIGVLGVVFEARPDALVQISALALKSGNGVLLKGGSEAEQTNRVLADIIVEASVKAGMPADWMALLETREDVKGMLGLDEYIDLIIPRGSSEFVRFIMDNTRIAVLGHAEGVCHVYVDGAADIDRAVRIAFDSKCQYAAVCNAMETLLVDEAIADEFLPAIKAEYDKAGVEVRGDGRAREIIEAGAASEADWVSEYNDLIVSVKVVAGVGGAIGHVNRYGSGHTDAIVTEDRAAAKEFLDQVDSANVFWNCSTRYADGFRYGLGAELGISTNKIHARGPVGLEGMVIYKWKLIGAGHVVADYSGSGAKTFTHRPLGKKYPL